MTSNYDPSTPLTAQATDADFASRARWLCYGEHPDFAIPVEQAMNKITREFAAAAVSDAVERERAIPYSTAAVRSDLIIFLSGEIDPFDDAPRVADALMKLFVVSPRESEERARRIPSRETLVQIIEDHAPNMIKSHGQRGACERCNALADAIFPLFQEPTP
ncbi:MAG TPA: hypothetical protein VN717_08635 [Gemmatimonadaceae bacterium]|nr:hypothetical protein [Gemmatimonadaceae bacterium]